VDNVPGITFGLPRSYAGSLSVNRTDHPENSMFFWGFEANVGSLAASKGERSEEPWAIWLNGG
jgi:carboxypeptidase D